MTRNQGSSRNPTTEDSKPTTFGEAIARSSVSAEEKSALLFHAAQQGMVGKRLEDHPAAASRLKHDLD